MTNINYKLLLKLLHYEPSTGVFTWRESPCCRIPAGARAGSVNTSRSDQPYWNIMVNAKNYRSGRLAWLYMTGKWPKREIDHRDGNPLNDVWSNLRPATSTQNKANQKIRRDNKTGFKGVHPCRNRFSARAHIRGVYKHLGVFDTAEEAAAAYRQATVAVHGEYVR